MEKYTAVPEDEEFLGRGTFGIVGRIVACKTIHYMEGRFAKAEVEREFAILARLQHVNIIRYLDVAWFPNRAKLYMEYCDKQSLQDLIQRNKLQNIKISEDYVWSILFQLIAALSYCHNGLQTNADGDFFFESSWAEHSIILHRDLKPANVLLSSSHGTQGDLVKLCDFGLGAMVEEDHAPSSYVGDAQYLAPEISRFREGPIEWDRRCDMFSFGCTLYALYAVPRLSKNNAKVPKFASGLGTEAVVHQAQRNPLPDQPLVHTSVAQTAIHPDPARVSPQEDIVGPIIDYSSRSTSLLDRTPRQILTDNRALEFLHTKPEESAESAKVPLLSFSEFDNQSCCPSKSAQYEYGGPHRRRGSTVASYGKQPYLFGGDDSGNFFTNIWAFDIESEAWYQCRRMGTYEPTPRFNHDAAIVNGVMYVFGGRTIRDNKRPFVYEDCYGLDAYDIEGQRSYTSGDIGLPYYALRSGQQRVFIYGNDIIILGNGAEVIYKIHTPFLHEYIIERRQKYNVKEYQKPEEVKGVMKTPSKENIQPKKRQSFLSNLFSH
ncbi:G2-specific serine/threonine protein kinase [Xylographa trunciseda]|nr:G2-specific serine/threonine protein kinase [Xylographa trunciseda]